MPFDPNKPGCHDMQSQCWSWALDDQCTLNPSFMRSICKHSCGLCDKQLPTPAERAPEGGGGSAAAELVHSKHRSPELAVPELAVPELPGSKHEPSTGLGAEGRADEKSAQPVLDEHTVEQMAEEQVRSIDLHPIKELGGGAPSAAANRTRVGAHAPATAPSPVVRAGSLAANKLAALADDRRATSGGATTGGVTTGGVTTGGTTTGETTIGNQAAANLALLVDDAAGALQGFGKASDRSLDRRLVALRADQQHLLVEDDLRRQGNLGEGEGRAPSSSGRAPVVAPRLFPRLVSHLSGVKQKGRQIIHDKGKQMATSFAQSPELASVFALTAAIAFALVCLLSRWWLRRSRRRMKRLLGYHDN